MKPIDWSYLSSLVTTDMTAVRWITILHLILLCEIDSESLDVGGAFPEIFSIALSLLDLAS
jgi:hypothetical protein